MINPHWLEQTYIVENAAVSYDEDEFELGAEDRPTRIVASKYRQFVGENPEKITYFQPILDKLDYAPSRLDLVERAIFVEGKSDFYVLAYYLSVLRGVDDVCVVPGIGATNMSTLISLYLGWGKSFVVLLDGDKEGVKARKRYIEDFGLAESRVVLFPDVAQNVEISEIEDILDMADLKVIQDHFALSDTPSKNNIMRFFQEKLASKERIELSEKAKANLDCISTKLSGLIQ
jgi:hypothetical protein